MEAIFHTPSILVIEPNAQLRMALRAFLKAEGWNITTTADSTEALCRLRGEPTRYELVLMELLLPEVHRGFEVLRQARQWGDLPPVIVMSTCTEPSAIRKSFELGVCDYLGKPFFAQKLRERIDVHLQLKCGLPSVRGL